MPRTTVDLDPTVLKELKRRQRLERKTLGQVVSELLVSAIANEGSRPEPEPLRWTAQPMRSRVDLDDKDALNAALDER